MTATPQLSPTEPAGVFELLFGPLLNLLYPPACTLCRVPLQANRWLCPDCADSLPRLVAPFCSRCAEPFDGLIERPFECPNCRDLKFAFSFARPALRNHPDTRGLIHDLKYRHRLHLAGELGRLTARAFADPRLVPALDAGWPIVPVPLHWRRQQRRHFNQSTEIARSLSRLTGLPLVRALHRIRDTGTQTHLTRRQRIANLHNAFRLSRAGRRLVRQPPPGAIVFDDVFTTGSTTHECSRVLRRAGIEKVVVVTVLRG